ncbi:PLC-like phosphodiesterase [Mycena rebaudengoi]|nr:PLC-like phosphodiesterase [Mycena rebaudengoi]
MVVGWPNDTLIFGSPRLVDAELNAQPNAAVNVTTIASSINETHWKWIYRCENCTKWPGGSLAVNGTQAMTWLVGLQPVPTPDADNSTLSARGDMGSWQQNLAVAHNSNYSDFALSGSNLWPRRTMFPSKNIGQSQYGPAITTHLGDIWISGVMNNQSLWYASGSNTAFAQTTTNVNSELAVEGPALAEFSDVLHLVFPDKVSGNLVHLQYNDTTATWGERIIMNATTNGPPALTVFNGALVCAYIQPSEDNRLYVTQWDPEVGWSPSYDFGGAPKSWGTTALYTLGSQIYIIFPANTKGRGLVLMSATEVNGTWNQITAPNQSTAYGVSAASYGTRALIAFQSNNGNGQLLADLYDGVNWNKNNEDTTQTTSHTPAIAVLDGVANCIFTSHDGSSTVLWVQRALTAFPLNSWMAHLSGSLLLSQLSIPGTHDSASVTTFPFTATQELSIIDQLDMGIRFLDLRCGLVNNTLQMFHSSISLGTSLQQMLAQIYAFLTATSTEGVVVSIKQDNSPINSNISFDAALVQLIQQQSQFWNTSTTMPQLQDIRGKIQLVRRYSGSVGIDATNWPDNSPGFTTPLPNGALVVEDRYDFDFILGFQNVVTMKTNFVLNALMAAQTDPVTTNWHISFSSASNTPFNQPKDLAVGGGSLAPIGYVVGINQRVLGYLISLGAPGPRIGTLLMDFIDTPNGGWLIEAMVALNG